ncbi:MAG TPA: TRAP transporter substrate-binding protein [Syntrophales bacterium]|nr:TRAP transporter substrate-binding protein [Syntrophales bacterium]HQB29277.1 TRAP transporter substrate-binding protein [Syntrophales bacterium]HQN77155.1 TRAP transporter substrate-binding protein [Syntrophales bacterium]HQQ25978.1 TRAP transporter substrate-binding protein [Syntrophales bacterium]
MMKRIGLVGLACCAFLVFGGCGGSSDKAGTGGYKAQLKLASLTPMSHTYNQGALKFADLVKERSNGRIQVTVYPDGQLGKGERELLEAVQQGTIDVYAGSTGPIGGFNPAIGILDIPFLFNDYGHVDKVLDGPLGQQLLDDLEKAQFKALAFWENGFRNLTNSRRPVRVPDDARGLKIRTMENKVHMEAWEAVGANPVPMAFGEVYGALQQKVLDGQENPVAVIYSVKLDEVQQYLSMTQHVYSPAVLIVSLKTWQSIPGKDREMLLQTAREVAGYQRRLGRDMEEKQLAELAGRGMKIEKNIDKAAWRSAMQPVINRVAGEYGKEKIDAILGTD